MAEDINKIGEKAAAQVKAVERQQKGVESQVTSASIALSIVWKALEAGQTVNDCKTKKAWAAKWKVSDRMCRYIIRGRAKRTDEHRNRAVPFKVGMVGSIPVYLGDDETKQYTVKFRIHGLPEHDSDFRRSKLPEHKGMRFADVSLEVIEESVKPAAPKKEKSALAGKPKTVHLLFHYDANVEESHLPADIRSSSGDHMVCMRKGRLDLHHTTTNRELVTCKRCLGMAEQPAENFQEKLAPKKPRKTTHFNKFGRLACKQTDGWAARRRTSTKVETEVTCKSCLREIAKAKRRNMEARDLDSTLRNVLIETEKAEVASKRNNEARQKRDEELDRMLEEEGISEPANRTNLMKRFYVAKKAMKEVIRQVDYMGGLEELEETDPLRAEYDAAEEKFNTVLAEGKAMGVLTTAPREKLSGPAKALAAAVDGADVPRICAEEEAL